MSAVDRVGDISVGTVVWIGEEGDPFHKATWTVVSLFESVDDTPHAVLSSGRTGRLRTVRADRLSKYRLTEVGA